MKSVFLALPVSDSLADDGTFRVERRQFFEGFVSVLNELGLDVMSAGTHEQWGAVKLSPTQFTRYDVESLLEVDALVVVTNERLNRDMYLETGIALARAIPIVFVVPASTKLTFMGLGLEEMGMIEVRRYNSEADAVGMLRDAIAQVFARA